MPPGSPKELVDATQQFSMLKLGFRGDMKFYPDPEVLEVAPLLTAPEKEVAWGQQQSM